MKAIIGGIYHIQRLLAVASVMLILEMILLVHACRFLSLRWPLTVVATLSMIPSFLVAVASYQP